MADQQKVIDEIEAIDKKIADEQAIITEQSEKVKSKFDAKKRIATLIAERNSLIDKYLR